MTRAFFLAAAGLALFGLSAAFAETVTQKALSDTTLRARDDDPAMKAAFAKAQESLPDFIEALDGKIGGASNFAVKVPINQGNQTEYFWLNEISHRGDRFTGKINNRPELVGNVTFGQQLTFLKSRIRDWGYYRDGKLQGNFTTCVLLAKENREEAQELKERIGLTCEDAASPQ
jgi:uncharacterized protein YegJ (DUF2314 family)